MRRARPPTCCRTEKPRLRLHVRVLVTRPEAQAAAWVARLAASGIAAAALPLIDIAAPADTVAVTAAWERILQPDAGHALRLVVFVSPNAAERFWALRPTGATWPAATLAGSPGPGTTDTLRQLGVPPEAIAEPAHDAPQFDSESLWETLRAHDWSGAQVLVVRGEGGGREWLADALRRHGARVAMLSAYRRVPPDLSAVGRELLCLALAAPADTLWLFSSSEAVANLQLLVPGSDWSRGRAVASHPRIAGAARRLGFGAVTDARPGFDEMVACIQSMRP
jgi:uroporphyrinogen-III synthase